MGSLLQRQHINQIKKEVAWKKSKKIFCLPEMNQKDKYKKTIFLIFLTVQEGLYVPERSCDFLLIFVWPYCE